MTTSFNFEDANASVEFEGYKVGLLAGGVKIRCTYQEPGPFGFVPAPQRVQTWVCLEKVLAPKPLMEALLERCRDLAGKPLPDMTIRIPYQGGELSRVVQQPRFAAYSNQGNAGSFQCHDSIEFDSWHASVPRPFVVFEPEDW